MKWKVPDGLLFTFYALPLFFFPLSTAGAVISADLFLLI
jgi:O-antigen ligase